MTSIFLDPDKLESIITRLKDLASAASTAKTSIDNESAALHDPVSVDGFVSLVSTRAEVLQSRAEDIEDCKNAIVALNSSGVGVKDSSGGITVEVPEGMTVGSSTDLQSWAQAAQDARDLEQLGEGPYPYGELPSGRSYDEVMASIEAGKSNPAYANGLVDALGAENLTQIPLDANDYFTSDHYSYGEISIRPEAGADLASLLGEVLATASTTWDESRAEEVSNAIYGSVDEKGEYGRITVLNAMLGGHDHTGGGQNKDQPDHVNDLTFNSHFLTHLADNLEDLDWNEINQHAGYLNTTYPDMTRFGEEFLGDHLDEQSFDPLAGVLDAMGHNPQAALDFLAPEGTTPDGSRTGGQMFRLDELSRRNWDTQGMEGFAGALGAASSMRHTDPSAPGASALRYRADDLAGHALFYLTTNTTEDDYSDTTKARLSTLLANCPAEITSVYQGLEPEDLSAPGHELPAVTADDILTMTYRIIDEPDAAATLSTAVGDYSRHRSSAGIALNEGNPQGQIDAINDAHTSGVQAAGFLGAMAEEKAAAMNASEEARANGQVSTANTVIGAFATITGTALGSVAGPVGAVAGSKAGATAWSVGSSVLGPVLADAVVPDAERVSSSLTDDPDLVVWGAAVQDAANNGLIDQQTLQRWDGKYEWIRQDPATGTYGIDLTGADEEDYRDVRTWTEWMTDARSRDERMETDEEHLEAIDADFNGSYATGREKGEMEAQKVREREK